MKVKVKGELKWVVWENILLRCIKNKGINLSLKNKLVVTLPTKLSQGYQTSESPQNKIMYVDEYYLKLMDIPDLLWLVIYKYNTQETDKECRFRAQELLLRSQSKTKIKRSFFTQKYLGHIAQVPANYLPCGNDRLKKLIHAFPYFDWFCS